MRKYVGAGFLLDETESLGFVEPFHGAGGSSHNFYLSSRNTNSPASRALLAGSVAITYENRPRNYGRNFREIFEMECIVKSALSDWCEYREISPVYK
jgi:hypothetical protein